jgi:hypothetical protein
MRWSEYLQRLLVQTKYSHMTNIRRIALREPPQQAGVELIVGWPSTAPSLVVGTSKCHAQASVTPRIP